MLPLPPVSPADAPSLLRGGYTILHLNDLKESWPDWEGKSPLPKLEEVRAAMCRANCGVRTGAC